MLSVFMCFYQNLVLVAVYRVDCWQTLQRRLSVTNLWCHKLIAEVNK